MRVGLGLAVLLVLVAFLAFGLTGTAAAPAEAPGGGAAVTSVDAVAENEPPAALVGSSAYTQLAE